MRGHLYAGTNASSVCPNSIGENNCFWCTVIRTWRNRRLALRRPVRKFKGVWVYLLRP